MALTHDEDEQEPSQRKNLRRAYLHVSQVALTRDTVNILQWTQPGAGKRVPFSLSSRFILQLILVIHLGSHNTRRLYGEQEQEGARQPPTRCLPTECAGVTRAVRALFTKASEEGELLNILYSVVFGRTLKNEHLALGTILSTVGLAVLALGGGEKEAAPSSGKTTLEQVKESVKFNASSSEEEQLVDSIKKFIEDAEKEAKH
ncbi:hypothetical protein WOLCODRAFT_165527 [Wolfiporia cocos MD-104 SS10]|uniref:Uncharacterized protein n=1 Tax=Wolfiporia cocos (strain MD-104) TaxID=742152 RepID=A0A2H3JSP7_WOLCO|nr:hypothetical protein WOLCODRAFT_165527 [Wolfiporia cocos MD-104 SS10]